jgi:hypothetical protein
MAGKTPKTTVKVAKKAATKRVDAKASRRDKMAPKSPFRNRSGADQGARA